MPYLSQFFKTVGNNNSIILKQKSTMRLRMRQNYVTVIDI